MGPKPSKEEKEVPVAAPVEQNESTGVHFVEVHAPSAGLGITGILFLLALIFAAFWLWKRGCCRLSHPRRSRRPEFIPQVSPLPLYHPQMVLDPRRPLYDLDRFQEIPDALQQPAAVPVAAAPPPVAVAAQPVLPPLPRLGGAQR